MAIDQLVTTGNEWERKLGYSRAVRCGNQFMTNGTVSMNDNATPFVPDDGYTQTMRCLETIASAVEVLGVTRADIA